MFFVGALIIGYGIGLAVNSWLG